MDTRIKAAVTNYYADTILGGLSGAGAKAQSKLDTFSGSLEDKMIRDIKMGADMHEESFKALANIKAKALQKGLKRKINIEKHTQRFERFLVSDLRPGLISKSISAGGNFLDSVTGVIGVLDQVEKDRANNDKLYTGTMVEITKSAAQTTITGMVGKAAGIAAAGALAPWLGVGAVAAVGGVAIGAGAAYVAGEAFGYVADTAAAIDYRGAAKSAYEAVKFW